MAKRWAFMKEGGGAWYFWDNVFNNGPSEICARQPLKKLKWNSLFINYPMSSLSISLNMKTQNLCTSPAKPKNETAR